MTTDKASIASLDKRDRRSAEAAVWRGPLRHYDIIKEATIAVAIVAVLAILLAVLFSSPDPPPVTLKAWSNAQPVGFTDIALSELDRTSNSATYGPPYNHGTGSVQYLFGFSIQKTLGITTPIDPARSFVLDPLQSLPDAPPSLPSAIQRWEHATAATRDSWTTAYAKALSGRALSSSAVPASWHGAGPVPELMTSLLAMARSGALDTSLVSHSSFYTTNYTNPILFIGDSWKAQHAASYWGKIVTAQKLSGTQWGVMNEVGSWPGQPWLWLYTMWYQISPMRTSNNGDVEVLAIMTVLSLVLLAVPLIPGIRDIPRRLPLHRVIWRRYYATQHDTET
jgi:hypothetical protein